MGDRPNRQHIPGSHLRNADGWEALDNRARGAAQTKKSLKKFNDVNPDPEGESLKDEEFEENLEDFGTWSDE